MGSRIQAEEISFLLADVSRLMRQAYQREARAQPLTLAQARALVYVERHEGLCQRELAQLLEVQPMTLAKLLDQLAALDLIERRADPKDRRAFRIHLRPQAQTQLAAVGKLAQRIRGRALEGLSAEQTQALADTLLHMRSRLSQR